MCESTKHKLKFIRQSMIFWETKPIIIDVYQCIECKKYLIIDIETDARLNLGGLIGTEIED